MKEKSLEYRLALDQQVQDRRRLAEEDRIKSRREAEEEDLRVQRELAVLLAREQSQRAEEEKKRTKYAQAFLPTQTPQQRKPQASQRDTEQADRGHRHQQEVRKLITDKPTPPQSMNYKQFEPHAHLELAPTPQEPPEPDEDLFHGLDTIGSFEADDRMNIQMKLNTDLSRKYVLSQMEERRKDMGLQDILARKQTPDPNTYSKEVLENRHLRHVLSRASTKNIHEEFQHQVDFLKQPRLEPREKERLMSRGRDALDEFAEGLIINHDATRQAASRQRPPQTTEPPPRHATANLLMLHTHQSAFKIEPLQPLPQDAKWSTNHSRQTTRNGFYDPTPFSKRNLEDIARTTQFSNETSNNFFRLKERNSDHAFPATPADEPSCDIGLKVGSPEPDPEQLHPHELLREASCRRRPCRVVSP